MERCHDCIIPVAGYSRRMKAWKPALPWGDATILAAVIDAALGAGCRVIVAGGWNYVRLRELTAGRPQVKTIYADGWEQGMDVTVKRALEYRLSDRFFVTPGDMPLIRSQDYRRLETTASKPVVRPEFHGRPGHPVLLSELAAQRILESADGTPLREVIKNLETGVVEWDHAGVIRDFDDPQTYRRFSGVEDGAE